MTVNQVAERLHVHPSRVRLMIRLGQIKGDKPGRDWMIEEKSVAAYERDHPRRPGRPKENP